MKIGYARISTPDQSIQLQIDALKEAGCEKIYQEVASGSKTARVVLDELMTHIRTGDVLIIWKLDRLGRNTTHLLQIAEDFEKRNISLISIIDKIDATGALGKLLFRFLASVAEFERDSIVERTKAGLAAARALGRIGGKRSWSKTGIPEHIIEKIKVIKILYTSKGITTSAIIKQAGISKPTLYRYLRLSKFVDGTDVEIGASPIGKKINYRNKNKEVVCG